MSYRERIESLPKKGTTDDLPGNSYALGLFNGWESAISECAGIAAKADADIEEKDAEIAALKADAERYRFQRDHLFQWFEPTGAWRITDAKSRTLACGSAYTYEAAIDAAIDANLKGSNER